MLTSAPEDYGLDADATLAHTVASPPPEDFGRYWAGFDEEVAALSTRWRGGIDEAFNEVVIPSIRDVRVVARVAVPDGPPRAVVITSHGSEAGDGFSDAPEPWTETGLATVRVRVRGYPPSTLDVDDLRIGWIMHRFPAEEGWILRGAVADVIQACRCAHRCFGASVPVMLHGESLGGGLAVIAGARLCATSNPAAPRRAVIGFPSLGDWRWREDRYCNGTGARINEFLTALRQERDKPRRLLQLFDAAHHAAALTCPVLFKLAVRDDVVPAPAAAAVSNAVPESHRWRFVTQFGHFDGGVADLRRHAWFERQHAGFLDPGRDCEAVADETLSRSYLSS